MKNARGQPHRPDVHFFHKPVETCFFIFQHIAPYHGFVIASQSQFGNIPAHRVYLKKSAQFSRPWPITQNGDNPIFLNLENDPGFPVSNGNFALGSTVLARPLAFIGHLKTSPLGKLMIGNPALPRGNWPSSILACRNRKSTFQ